MDQQPIELSGSRDGTSQRDRILPALDPASAPIDGRGTRALLEFVQKMTQHLLRYEAGPDGTLVATDTWEDFASRRDNEVSVDDMVAYLADPSRFSGEKARWLGRPHFGLLLTFLELLGWARDQQNGLTEKHLDYFYKDVLRMRPRPAELDRAIVLCRLSPRVAELWLPAGTALDAGRDSAGLPRIYRTERELIVNRAEVAELRSVRVPVVGLAQVQADRSLSTSERLDAMLRLALGQPAPGDPIPQWNTQSVDSNFLATLKEPLEFAGTDQGLHLAHHELRDLMRLVRRRDEGRGWPQINEILKLQDLQPNDPQDFDAYLAKAIGVEKLDFSTAPSGVQSADDLYEQYRDPDARESARQFIDDQLRRIGVESFDALMQLKRRVDAEWAGIRRVVKLARSRGSPPGGELAGRQTDPIDVEKSLREALGPSLPATLWGCENIAKYEAKLRDLERYLGLPVEGIQELADFAQDLGAGDADASQDRWVRVEVILTQAYREKVCAKRREQLDEIGRRSGSDQADAKARAAALDKVATFVLSRPNPAPEPPLDWNRASKRLARDGGLKPTQIDLLNAFRTQCASRDPFGLLDWPDAYRLLELAWRRVERLPEPIPERCEWWNLHAFPDARACRDRPESPHWHAFGTVSAADKEKRPDSMVGWALTSPLLALGGGKRTLTLTLGLRPQGFNRDALTQGLGLVSNARDEVLKSALGKAWIAQLSTPQGWVEVEISGAKLASESGTNDYWSLTSIVRPTGGAEVDRPALQIQMIVGADKGPIAPLADSPDPWPALRVLLRPNWDEKHEKLKEWTTLAGAFQAIEIAAVHVQVEVTGLADLRLQQEERALDPRQPFEPFGGQPVAGVRLYLSHSELLRHPLDSLTFHLEWMGQPKDLVKHYRNYSPEAAFTSADFAAQISLIDRRREIRLSEKSVLFAIPPGDTQQAVASANPLTTSTSASQQATSATPSDSGGWSFVLGKGKPADFYEDRWDFVPSDDLRLDSRCLAIELKSDLGHAAYPGLAALWAAKLAVEVANKTVTKPEEVAAYQINPPYTPKVKRLTVSYTASIEIDPKCRGESRLLHVHPFGTAPLDPEAPSLVPRCDLAGQLYIGLRNLDPPRHLALLIQLAEGTGDADLDPGPVAWSCLDADRWKPVEVVQDDTRGLGNSGIVELDLPVVAPSTQLPTGLYWLRVAVARNPEAIPNCVDIRAQAVEARFEDRGNAPDHYARPLPAGTIARLAEPDARVVAVEQPFASFGGRPPEPPDRFRTRVSERLRHRQRALAPWDYERLVLDRFPSVYKAKCLPAADGPGTVTLLVIPDLRGGRASDPFAPRASAALLADIRAYLQERAPPFARIAVRNPRYVPVKVRLAVRFMPGQDETYAKRRLKEDMIRFLSPWAFDAGAELTIGACIYANGIVDLVDRCDYVDYATGIELFRGENATFIPPPGGAGADYHVRAESADEVLVAARDHVIDSIPELEYDETLLVGIGHMKIGLDFFVSSSPVTGESR